MCMGGGGWGGWGVCVLMVVGCVCGGMGKYIEMGGWISKSGGDY